LVQESGELKLQVHLGISNLREFVETFLYYFSQGANSEVVTANNEMFLQIVDQIKKELNYDHSLGGHSSIFCMRAQLEGCKCYMSPVLNSYNKSNLKVTPVMGENYLLLPKGKEAYDPNNTDIHLAIEYQEGDSIHGFTASRSNRFYFDMENNGAYLKQMDSYHEN
jgi:ADP-dependent phosphofructokinase/glucokinase